MTRILFLLTLAVASTIAGEIGGGGDDFPVLEQADFPAVEQAPEAAPEPVHKPPRTMFTPPKTLVGKPKPSSSEETDRTDSVNKTGGDRAGYEPHIQPIYDGGSYSGGSSSYGSNDMGACRSLRYRNKCYFLALSQESWHTGRDYCARIGQTLARIESSDEATFLASYLREAGHRNYWIDLNDERTEGVWTHTDNSVGFTDWWAPNEPNGNRGENCGLLVIGRDRIGRLVDEPCGEWRRYICERRTENVCRRSGYKNKCYWFSVQPSTWFNAREYCATIGMRMARVTATDESNFLARVMPRNSWIDLRYGGQGVGWTYADGSRSSMVSGLFGGGGFGAWGHGPRCAELRRYNQKEGRAIGADCNSLRQFICESETLPAGSEAYNPEDMPGSVIGSQFHGPAVGPGGHIGPMNHHGMGFGGMAGGMGGMGGMGPMGGHMGGMGGQMYG